MDDDISQNAKKTEKCSVSVTPFSINDILSNKLEPVEDDSELQESALDMSKNQIGSEGNQIHIYRELRVEVGCFIFKYNPEHFF